MLAAPLIASAQDRSAAAARAGQAVADAFNARNDKAFIALVDMDQLAEAVLKDLPFDKAGRASAREGMEAGMRGVVQQQMRQFDATKARAKLLRVRTAGDTPLAIVRIEMGSGAIDFIEYSIAANGKVVDWLYYGTGVHYAADLRTTFALLFHAEGTLVKLFGINRADPQDLAVMKQIVQQMQQQNFAGAFDSLEALSPPFRATRMWATMRVGYGSRAGPQQYRAALQHLAAHYGTDEELALPLLNYFVEENNLGLALDRLDALQRHLEGEDAATLGVKASLLIGMKRYDTAASACRKGIELERDNQNPYWCLVDAGLKGNQPQWTVEGLNSLETVFKMRFNPDALAKSPAFQEFARTPEFAQWSAAHRQ